MANTTCGCIYDDVYILRIAEDLFKCFSPLAFSSVPAGVDGKVKGWELVKCAHGLVLNILKIG